MDTTSKKSKPAIIRVIKSNFILMLINQCIH